jgi:hypothetical protein
MAWYVRKHKFGATRTVCHAGHSHPSKLEAKVCDSLTLLLKANKIKSLEQQKAYPFIICGGKLCNHVPDFTITHLDDSLEVVEAKGFATPEFKLKKKLFTILYPSIPYRVITKA